jgi:hypothetical protein
LTKSISREEVIERWRSWRDSQIWLATRHSCSVRARQEALIDLYCGVVALFLRGDVSLSRYMADEHYWLGQSLMPEFRDFDGVFIGRNVGRLRYLMEPIATTARQKRALYEIFHQDLGLPAAA